MLGERWLASAMIMGMVLMTGCATTGERLEFQGVPGVVVDHSPASSEQYVGSPGICVLSNGDYLAKDDRFGPKQPVPTLTRVFRSTDRGRTWSHLSDMLGMTWASIFVHRENVYLMGTDDYNGRTVIRKSSDGGKTWTVPVNKDSGLLVPDGRYHCAPVPVVEHSGRLWRGMEDSMGPGNWGHHFRAFMMSAPVDADLLKADNWISTNHIGRDPEWLDNKFDGWLEGNAVVTPDGHIVDFLRVAYSPEGEKAAIINISDDGKTATFDPETGFVGFPGGAVKFTIRFDPTTRLYWSLTNYIPPKHAGPDPGGTRNTLTLTCSPDLRHWTVKCVLLYHPDRQKHGFQYVDWLFEGNDLIAVCRTAFDDGLGGAHNMHDANFMTFHRVKNFRKLTMKDSVPFPKE